MDRFDFEEQFADCASIQEELEAILYKVGDSPTPPTEDELMNLLIGVIELHKVRYERAFNTFETLIKDGVLTNPPGIFSQMKERQERIEENT